MAKVPPHAHPPAPTDGELAILRVLWDHGPCTVRQVHDHLGRSTAYTTALKLLQIMAEKKLVTRADAPPPARGHLYAAALPAVTTQRQIVRRLVDKVFAGSASNLVLQALSAKRASAAELAEIRKLLDSYDRKGSGK